MEKNIYILGISESHTASAALLKNGEIIACASEERFTRKKLQAGIPAQAIKFCLDVAGIDFGDITKVAAADIEPPFLPPFDSPYSKHKPPFPLLIQLFLNIEEKIEEIYPLSQKFFYNLYKQFIRLKLFQRQRKRLINLQKIIPLPPDKFIFAPHHTCHAATALFCSPYTQENKPILVLTCDGVGDFESATISKYHAGKLKKLTSIDFQQSLGFFYQHITQYLGLKPVEDEYKVMGLAPYADHKKAKTVYEILRPYFKISKSENRWILKVSEYHIWRKLPKLLAYKRFDYIASAVQQITEEILCRWIENAVQNFKIDRVICGGGVFANIKVNQKIAQLKSVKSAFFMPSPGDESNAIGAACRYYFQLSHSAPQPLSNLYLGPSFSEKAVRQTLNNIGTQITIQKPRDINSKVAELLAAGEVVARFAGRMEFGSRALGNRSILASPKDKSVVDFINMAIKNRDFWMPFAPTILRERTKDYLVLHKADSPFMTVSFETTQKARSELAAAIHPYDKTTRPQILDKYINPSYYDLIKKFEKLTGIGALLNTSFNLHGEPIVATPQDALRVFKLSKLNYLILENYLVAKRD